MASTSIPAPGSAAAPGRFTATKAAASTGVDPFHRGRLNLNSGHLQEELALWVEKFNAIEARYVRGERYDVRANGMLSDIVASTPVIIYDLPALKLRVPTAFVDTTGRMYICDTFYMELAKEQSEGKDSLFFVLRHEAEHLRRLHLQRMLDLGPGLANEAQDIRINLDIIKMAVGNAMAKASKDGSVKPGPAFDAEVKRYIDNIGESISGGMGLSEPEYKKYEGWSEERIGAELFKNHKAPPKQPDRDVSFTDLMEGVAQDMDALEKLGLKSGNHLPDPAGAGGKGPLVSAGALKLAVDLRAIGAARGKAALPTIQAAVDGLIAMLDTQEMTGRDLQHIALQPKGGAKAGSVSTKDTWINELPPRERVTMAAKVLNTILNPSQGAGKSTGGLTIKDLDAMVGKSGKPQEQTPGAPGTPEANVSHGGDHVMTAQELAGILNAAGLQDAVAKLGYDDLAKISAETEAAKQNTVSAVNKASEDMMKVGANRMPGSHMVDYAVAMMNELYKPVLTLKMSMKEIIEGCGKGIRYEEQEPWAPFYVDHEDMGLGSSQDIPYMGSYIPGRTDKSVVIVPIDTSGSVDDAMLKRFVTEAINFAKDERGEGAPEVLVVWADTVCRGAPVLVNEDNVDEFLKGGINYGGRGGTSFQASIQQIFQMFKPGGFLEDRKMDAMIYFTDSFDTPPNQYALESTAAECGFSKLPTTLFLVPQQCHNDAFAAGVADWATTVFFNTSKELGAGSTNEIDLEVIEENLSARGKRNSMAAA